MKSVLINLLGEISIICVLCSHIVREHDVNLHSWCLQLLLGRSGFLQELLLTLYRRVVARLSTLSIVTLVEYLNQSQQVNFVYLLSHSFPLLTLFLFFSSRFFRSCSWRSIIRAISWFFRSSRDIPPLMAEGPSGLICLAMFSLRDVFCFVWCMLVLVRLLLYSLYNVRDRLRFNFGFGVLPRVFYLFQ